MSDQAPPAAMVCRHCAAAVTAGRFCERCGACQTRRRIDGPDWLRARYYCAAPDESLGRPALISTIFPRLPRTLRPAFGRAAAGLVVVLAAVVSARWQVAGIAIAVFGFPVLLGAYLYCSGSLRGQPRRPWVVALLTGAALGVGWALLTGTYLSRSYGIGVGAAMAGGPKAASLGVPLGAVLVMIAPAVIVRLMYPHSRDPLQGFTIGVLGATSFGLTATLARLGPQLATGLVARQRPLDGLIVEAGIRGIVIPLTSASFGGIAGLALWFTRRRAARGSRLRPILIGIALAATAVAGGGGLAEAADLGPARQLLVHLALTATALAALRLSLHLALLHRPRETHHDRRPARCPECGGVEGSQAFCPHCGVALCDPSPADRAVRSPLVVLGGGLTLAVAAMTAVSVMITQPVPRYACPPDCGSPPTGQALRNNPRFTAPGGEFSVDYPPAESGYNVTTDSHGVAAVLTHGDGGMLRLVGQPALGRSAQQVVADFVARDRPTARRAYDIPNAMVGYQPGYGRVDDDYPVSATGAYARDRVVTLAAVKDDYALIAAAAGPFHQFGPDFGPGPPSAVNLQIALTMDDYVNSFTWDR